MGKVFIKKALSRRVLVVAVINDDIKDWAAYIDAVEGKNHETEMPEVARTGNKLPFAIARLLFPQIAADYEWRD